MGDLIRAQIREEVIANLGRGSVSGDDISSDRYNRNIHLAQIRIARAYPWVELESIRETAETVVGNVLLDRYTSVFSTPIRNVYSVRILWSANTYRVHYLPMRAFDKVAVERGTNTVTQRPQFYTIDNSTRFELWPVPDQNYTLISRESVWPTDFSSDTDTSDLEKKDDLIINLASSIMFHSLGMREDGAFYFNMYRDMLDRAKEDQQFQIDHARVPTGLSEEIHPRGEYWRDPFQREEP